jgi:hydroxypyruvate reductase
LKPENSLRDNDAHSFFRALGDSVITGPTLTNVNDFRAILVEAGGRRIGDRKPLSGTL